MSGKYEIDDNEIVFSDANRYENLLPPRQSGGSGDIPAHSIGKDKLTSVLAAEIDAKTKKHILDYVNGEIRENNRPLTYGEIYNMLMASPDFVVLVANNKAYHPNIVNFQEIAFISTYPNGGYNETDRIVIKSNNTVSKSLIANEKKDNKVSSITASNKTSGTNYPSNKAFTEYVDKLTFSDDIYNSESELDNTDKSKFLKGIYNADDVHQYIFIQIPGTFTLQLLFYNVNNTTADRVAMRIWTGASFATTWVFLKTA